MDSVTNFSDDIRTKNLEKINNFFTRTSDKFSTKGFQILEMLDGRETHQ